jgi:hypothetical protein
LRNEFGISLRSENKVNKNEIYTKKRDFRLVSVISTLFPWSPLELHSNSTPWSGNRVEFQKLNGVGVEVRGVGVGIGVGIGMELEILNF